MNNSELYNYTLRLADNALILGQRLSELCSKGPFLEEDLAQTNIALDYIGRAQSLYNYEAQLSGKPLSEDELAYRRAENNYYNVLLVEQPDEDFAHTIARQFFYSVADCLFYAELTKSKNETLASIAKKVIKESKYHLNHSSDWVKRLGGGTELSHEKMQNAVNALWMYTDELFEIDDIEHKLIKEGVAVNSSNHKSLWLAEVTEVFKEAGLSVPENNFMMTGGRSGNHSEHFGHLLSELQYLQRAYPDATW